MKEITKIGIVGAGLMGHGIAQTFALHGYSVNIFDSVEETLAAVPGKIQSNFKVFLELGLVSETDVKQCLEKITSATTLRSCQRERMSSLRPCRKTWTSNERFLVNWNNMCHRMQSSAATPPPSVLQKSARV